MAKEIKKVQKKVQKKDIKKDAKKVDEKKSVVKKFDFNKKVTTKLFICKCGDSYSVDVLSSSYLVEHYQSEINIPICHNCHTTKTKKDTLLDESGNLEKFNSKFSYNIDGDKK